ncbi:MAG TPA: hypothetical protein VLU73_14760 [Methylococcaceae bacterium]|nr:hypothetical protein [Methylococcaceae bacterium]
MDAMQMPTIDEDVGKMWWEIGCGCSFTGYLDKGPTNVAATRGSPERAMIAPYSNGKR